MDAYPFSIEAYFNQDYTIPYLEKVDYSKVDTEHLRSLDRSLTSEINAFESIDASGRITKIKLLREKVRDVLWTRSGGH